VAEELLVRAASVAAARNNGDTALHWACYRGDLSLVKLLLGYGAPLETEGEYHNRPLHLACTTNQVLRLVSLSGRRESVQTTSAACGLNGPS
jgi:ankyrin repeat protein